MAALAISDLRLAPSAPSQLYGRNVEFPKAGQAVDGRVLSVVGWVVGREAAAVAVEILAAGVVVARAAVDVERPDVAAALPVSEDARYSGFRANLAIVSADPHLDLEVVAVLASQARVPFAALRVTAGRDGQPSSRARVSVIIPCYNQAHYLDDAIASVAGQTRGQPEVIVIDDGSTDNTREVAARYPGVRYVWQANAGLAAARNTGLRHSSAANIVFLDADDRLLPLAFDIGLHYLETRPRAAFVVGAWRLIGHDGSILSTPRQEPVVGDAYQALLRMCFISTPAAVMIRRAAVEAAGGFDTTVSASADYDLYLRLARRWPIHCHGKTVAEYRRHGANMTLNRALMLRAELTVLRRQWPHVRQDPQLVEALWEGLHRSQDYHGGRLAREIGAEASLGRWDTARRGGLSLLRHHPAALIPAGREAADVVTDLSLRVRHAVETRVRRDRGASEGYESSDMDQAPWAP